MAFLCTACGACCLAVNLHPELRHLASIGGRCRHLNLDNRCDIYETRPDACRQGVAYERYGKGMSREDWDRLSNECCIFLQRIYGVPREKMEPILIQLRATAPRDAAPAPT